MLAPDSRFVVNAPEVAAQVIDGEAIIMNLTTGMYYSLDRVGAVVWEWLERGDSVEEMNQRIATRYEVSPSQAQADLDRLIDQLLQDGLVSVSSASERPGERGGPLWAAEERLPYHVPSLIRYEDMADLLALDPPMPVIASTPWRAPEENA